jgi:hypothetical protein
MRKVTRQEINEAAAACVAARAQVAREAAARDQFMLNKDHFIESGHLHGMSTSEATELFDKVLKGHQNAYEAAVEHCVEECEWHEEIKREFDDQQS